MDELLAHLDELRKERALLNVEQHMWSRSEMKHAKVYEQLCLVRCSELQWTIDEIKNVVEKLGTAEEKKKLESFNNLTKTCPNHQNVLEMIGWIKNNLPPSEEENNCLTSLLVIRELLSEAEVRTLKWVDLKMRPTFSREVFSGLISEMMQDNISHMGYNFNRWKFLPGNRASMEKELVECKEKERKECFAKLENWALCGDEEELKRTNSEKCILLPIAIGAYGELGENYQNVLGFSIYPNVVSALRLHFSRALEISSFEHKFPNFRPGYRALTSITLDGIRVKEFTWKMYRGKTDPCLATVEFRPVLCEETGEESNAWAVMSVNRIMPSFEKKWEHISEQISLILSTTVKLPAVLVNIVCDYAGSWIPH